MAKILVTGGAGQLGGALAKCLSKNPKHFIVSVDNLSTGSIDKVRLCDNIRFINADINNYNDIVPVFGRFDFDFVFHFAAVVGVKRTLEQPIDVLNDIEGIKNILSLSKNSGVKRVFYASSSEVYGEPFEIPQNENTTPLNSRLPYAIVKNVGEAFFKAYKKEYDLDYTIFRFFNTYGPNQSNDFVIPIFVKLALKNQPIPIYGKGDQTRSFCFIDDNIDTCVKTLENDLHINDVLNIGNDEEINILEVAKKVINITHSDSEIIHLPALEEGDMKRRCPDLTKMKAVLNRDLVTLDQGLEVMMKCCESNSE